MTSGRWYTPHQPIAVDVTGLSHRRLHTRSGPETLAVLCWCQMTTIEVPRQMIMDCQTASCGEVWCHEPV